MRTPIALTVLLTCITIVAAQAPPAADGVVFTTDTNGNSYPYLFALKNPPPYAIKGSGAVDRVKYPAGLITSTDLKVTITSQRNVDGQPSFQPFDIEGKADANGLTFRIISPVGGIPEAPVTVTVTGRFKPSATQPERSFSLSGIASPIQP